MNNTTYIEVCEQIAEWLRKGTNNKINLTGGDIFKLHPQGELMWVHFLYDYMQENIDPVEMLLSDNTIAGLIINKVKSRENHSPQR